jgi:hypothetical protein
MVLFQIVMPGGLIWLAAGSIRFLVFRCRRSVLIYHSWLIGAGWRFRGAKLVRLDDTKRLGRCMARATHWHNSGYRIFDSELNGIWCFTGTRCLVMWTTGERLWIAE